MGITKNKLIRMYKILALTSLIALTNAQGRSDPVDPAAATSVAGNLGGNPTPGPGGAPAPAPAPTADPAPAPAPAPTPDPAPAPTSVPVNGAPVLPPTLPPVVQPPKPH